MATPDPFAPPTSDASVPKTHSLLPIVLLAATFGAITIGLDLGGWWAGLTILGAAGLIVRVAVFVGGLTMIALALVLPLAGRGWAFVSRLLGIGGLAAAFAILSLVPLFLLLG